MIESKQLFDLKGAARRSENRSACHPAVLRRRYAHQDISRKRSMLVSMKNTKTEHSGNIRELARRPRGGDEGIEQ